MRAFGFKSGVGTLFLGFALVLGAWGGVDEDLPLETSLERAFEYESPHLQHLEANRFAPHPVRALKAMNGEAPKAKFPLTKGEKKLVAYGYLPFWEQDAEIPWEDLTHLGYFSAEITSEGAISASHGWGGQSQLALVEEAHSHGVRVDLVVTLFSSQQLHDLLIDPEHRATLVDNLVALLVQGNGDGINLDFEGLPLSVKEEYVSFVLELNTKLWEVKPDGEVSLAMPAVDWKGAYDYDLLAAASDFLFVMCYGYHWPGGDPGPAAPLFGDGPFSDYSIAWTMDDYITWGGGEDVLDQLVIGLPVYGHDWPSEGPEVPGVQSEDGKAVTYGGVINGVGFEAFQTEPVTGERYRTYQEGAQWHQVFLDDADTTAGKVAYVLEQGARGYGFWAIGYDDNHPAYWGAIAQSVLDTLGEPPAPPEPPEKPDAGSSSDTSSFSDVSSYSDDSVTDSSTPNAEEVESRKEDAAPSSEEDAPPRGREEGEGQVTSLAQEDVAPGFPEVETAAGLDDVSSQASGSSGGSGGCAAKSAGHSGSMLMVVLSIVVALMSRRRRCLV